MPFPAFARWMLLIAVALLFVRNDVVVSDTWWALRAGQDMWHSHHVLLHEAYSYTANGAAWPNHEWLWEVIAYAVFAVAGLPALTVLNGALAVGALALARIPGKTAMMMVALLVPAVLLENTEVVVRPQVATLFCLSLMLWLLVREHFWPLIPLTVVWANLHGGVTLGISLLGCATLVALWRAFRHREAGDVRRAWVLGATSIGCVAATLLTPLGIGLWTYVESSVARSKQNHIIEWRSAFQLSAATDVFWITVIALLAAAIVYRRRITGWAGQLLMVATLAMFIEGTTAVRNIACYALVALPFAMLLIRGTPDRRHSEVPHARWWLASFGAVATVIGIFAYTFPPAKLGWTPVSVGVRVAVADCPGHVYNTFNSGGELIWWTPKSRIFVDNRQDPYPQSIIELGLLGSPGRSTAYRSTFKRYDVRCAVVAKRDRVVKSILAPDGWSVAYQDSEWMVMTAPGVRLRASN